MKMIKMANNIFVIYIFLILFISYVTYQNAYAVEVQKYKQDPAVFNNFSTMGNNGNPLQSRNELKRYMTNKYKQVERAESHVEQTPYGPSGRILILGNIVPTKKTSLNLAAEPDRHVRARAIAKAFIDDEPTLLGIIDSREIKETDISTFNGFKGDYTNISYKRFINGIELLGGHIVITIGSEENISGIQADLAPVPPIIYESTKKKTRTENQIRSIVEADLKENNIDTTGKLFTLEKLVTLEPPYVIWRVMTVYSYTLNAFTGEILEKHRSGKSPKPAIKKAKPDAVMSPLPPMVGPSQ